MFGNVSLFQQVAIVYESPNIQYHLEKIPTIRNILNGGNPVITNQAHLSISQIAHEK